jgi:mannosyltransferase
MNGPDRRRRVAAPLLLLAITLLGGALRFYAIGRKGLWLDEAFSVWLGWQRLPEMWGWIARIDQHPPLYYTLLHLWMRLGDDAATVRMLSAAASTLTIPIIYALGRRLAGLWIGLLAALVLAVSPFHVRFAQEARMYALLALTASAAMACLAYLLSKGPAVTGSESAHEAADRDFSLGVRRNERLAADPLRMTGKPAGSHRNLGWAGYVVFTAAAMLTHSTALLLPAAMNLFVFGLSWRQARSLQVSQTEVEGNSAEIEPFTNSHPSSEGALRSPELRTWLIAQAGVLLLWGAIWLPAFIGQAGGVYREFWMPAPTWRAVVDTLGNFLSAHLPRHQMPWLDGVWAFFAALLALGIMALRRRPAVLALLLTLFLTPLLGELLISLRRPVFYDRTLIWATIPLYVLMAAGMAAMRRRPLVLAAVALLIAANGLSLREYYANFQKEGWKEAVAAVGPQVRAGDLILFNASWVQIPFDFYYREANKPVDEHGLPVDLFERGVLEPKMAPEDLPRLRELIEGRQRVWLVYSHNWYTDPQGLIPEALAQALTPVERRAYAGLEIQLYEGAGPGWDVQ